MTNLLEETIEQIEGCGHTTNEVNFVADGKSYCGWEDFARTAKNYDYDEDYGSAEVNMDLVVVGSGWWLERNEYDGSEWWEYKSLPIAPNNYGEVRLEEAEDE